jgi:hypothetical protein
VSFLDRLHGATFQDRGSSLLRLAVLELAAAVGKNTDRIITLEAASATQRTVPPSLETVDPQADAEFRCWQGWGEVCAARVSQRELLPGEWSIAIWPSDCPNDARWLDRDQTAKLRDWLTEQLEASR